MKKFVIKKCSKCGALVKVLKDCNCKDCGIVCCGEEMKVLLPNESDAAKEKHVPTYEVKNGKLIITVNHVMEKDHFIEWVSIVDNDAEITTYFKPEEEIKIECIYKKNIEIYSYCNKHGLWMTLVK